MSMEVVHWNNLQDEIVFQEQRLAGLKASVKDAESCLAMLRRQANQQQTKMEVNIVGDISRA